MGKLFVDKNISITDDYTDEDYDTVGENLYAYNVDATKGLLTKPESDIHLFLKDKSGKVVGGICCETYSYCLYIDMFWVSEKYRNKGYGKLLINEAERIGKKAGCTFAHTSTFSYQSPHFYKNMGYEVFGVIEDYPEDIKQFFLKKKL
ncbi:MULTISPECIES: GNAT family N-acetyltransferase [Bacillus cereus group]|uniref:N-acetyltransferase n=3 Tax=Bacillus cereus group TaxID=86661 RepID=A0A243CWS8_BACTU|nr:MULTISPECIES: GNAT family N-acetyltransferase [Bacillus cereus group]EEM56635.1 Acetyltransferase, gnat [Bacillus thuringiensis serovar monterrey BGSC 4AJ1]EEM86568.1 Acetyltransferase, gnat [Bacillus thuringiensis serovar pulsiensis BGSC 4CC1]MEB9674176.1 GNAT family N-acetyltransferase [Bacillus anthracis]MEB9908179.1 GNAT family N-acetyltransferase [Bacillus anthracis]MEC1957010.1 GNAT family N-acetyltransferase [Bacillus anthracis]